MVTLQELLGARIRICIEKHGYRTVEEFAFAFGIGKSTLSDILTGKKSPTVTTLARWANALGMPLSEFFEDERINHWVRETPPEYFHNRAKPSGDPAKAATPRKSTRALKGATAAGKAEGPSTPTPKLPGPVKRKVGKKGVRTASRKASGRASRKASGQKGGKKVVKKAAGKPVRTPSKATSKAPLKTSRRQSVTKKTRRASA